MKRLVVRLHWLLAKQFGIDVRRLIRSVRGVPPFLRDWWQFRRGYTGPLVWLPCLHDRYEEGGTTRSEYFWQDLLVARWIFEAGPERHVDVGSRVDGFVAHVAAFREIEVFDVRPITTEIPGIRFKQVDLTSAGDYTNGEEGYCDSLSCLHALEHFGLGRYGDPINPHGPEKGIGNMAALLKPGGTLYLSTPIGREQVLFNAHRVFDPRTILAWAAANHLHLSELTALDAGGNVRSIDRDSGTLDRLAKESYVLGMFTFVKQ